MEFTHPMATNYAESGIYTTPVRCDGVLPEKTSTGCVYPAGKLTFTESATGADPNLNYKPAPGNAQFIRSEQQNHPEWGITQPLHRRYNPEFNNMIRTQNCQGFQKQSDDDSCDEFPFASTYENIGPGTASVGHVSSTDNSHGGTNLGIFLRENRVLDDDPYYVQIID